MELTRGRVLIPGEAEGEVLRLTRPISFWGGVDSDTGSLLELGERGEGATVAGKILVVAATRGSSSSSAIMLELLRNGHAPEALVMAKADAILVLGVIVAREMGWPTIPVIELPRPEQERLETGMRVTLSADGRIAQVA